MAYHHLVIQKFEKATGAYQDGWIVQPDLPATWEWDTPFSTAVYGWERGLALDPVGALWVGTHGQVSRWSTSGEQLAVYPVLNTTGISRPMLVSEVGATAEHLYALVSNPYAGAPSIWLFGPKPFYFAQINRYGANSGELLNTWLPPYAGGYELLDAHSLVVDPAARVNGRSLWVVYTKTVGYTTTSYLAAIAPAIPSGSYLERYLTGNGNASPYLPYYAFDPHWAGGSFWAAQNRPTGAPSQIISRLRPVTQNDYLTRDASPITTTATTTRLHADAATQHVLLVSRQEQCYREYTAAGALVRASETFHNPLLNGASGCYVYDITADSTSVYVLLVVQIFPKEIATDVDDLFGFHHAAYTAGYGLNHALAPLDAASWESASLLVSTGTKPSIKVLPDGRLCAAYTNSSNTTVVRYSRDMGKTWGAS